jgi:hypothetical protein
MAIKFVPLTDKQQAEIWRLWFNRAKDAIDPSFNLEEALDYEDGTGTLTKHNLNGREIRNIVRSAMSLAMSDTDRPRKLMWKHVERVLGSTLAFKNVRVDLKMCDFLCLPCDKLVHAPGRRNGEAR